MTDMHALLGAYVADALDHQESKDFEEHLQGCAGCRREVAELRETMAELGEVHEVAPPPALRASILDAISTTPMLPAAEAEPPPITGGEVVPIHRPSRRRRPVSAWLAAAALVLAVALGGVAVWQQSNLQSIQAAEAQRAELLAAPDLQVSHTTLEGAPMTYLVSAGQGQALVASPDLPAPGADRSWQVWVMQDGVPRSGAVVDRGGQLETWISGVPGGEALAVTNEPRGGSQAPTGEVQALFEF